MMDVSLNQPNLPVRLVSFVNVETRVGSNRLDLNESKYSSEWTKDLCTFCKSHIARIRFEAMEKQSMTQRSENVHFMEMVVLAYSVFRNTAFCVWKIQRDISRLFSNICITQTRLNSLFKPLKTRRPFSNDQDINQTPDEDVSQSLTVGILISVVDLQPFKGHAPSSSSSRALSNFIKRTPINVV